MTPFTQQMTMTAVAVGLYILPFLVPSIPATWLHQLSTMIIGSAWVPRPHEIMEKRKKARESAAPSNGHGD